MVSVQKIHLRCEGKGKPITFILSPGQRNESIFLEQLMEQGAVRRSGRGRPRLRPLRLVGVLILETTSN
ncbi:hypothetical protein [Nostoc sp.]|uniref:hypothetical protein n=1 Tax=Nostoc sp. TaxID=1180 RepID=UPI002FF51E5C